MKKNNILDANIRKHYGTRAEFLSSFEAFSGKGAITLHGLNKVVSRNDSHGAKYIEYLNFIETDRSNNSLTATTIMDNHSSKYVKALYKKRVEFILRFKDGVCFYEHKRDDKIEHEKIITFNEEKAQDLLTKIIDVFGFRIESSSEESVKDLKNGLGLFTLPFIFWFIHTETISLKFTFKSITIELKKKDLAPATIKIPFSHFHKPLSSKINEIQNIFNS